MTTLQACCSIAFACRTASLRNQLRQSLFGNSATRQRVLAGIAHLQSPHPTSGAPSLFSIAAANEMPII